MSRPDYLLCFYVPKKEASFVKKRVFEMGAGTIGDYECCAFETSGLGQFRPINNAKPAIGSIGKLESVEELKVELVCTTENIQAAVDALKEAHPYEEPAYHVLKMEAF